MDAVNGASMREKVSPEVVKDRIISLFSFGRLPGASRAALLELCKVEHVGRKQRILQQGEPAKSMFLVGSGRVKVERVSQGRVFPIGHRGPGDIVGETAIANSGPATESAIVLDDIESLALPIQPLRKLLGSDGALRNSMLNLLTERHLTTEARLASLLLYGVETRLIEFLTTAAKRWGQPHASGELISTPFTHADIALLIGSTRETVTLLLGQLKRDGLISFDRRRVILRDSAALAKRGVPT